MDLLDKLQPIGDQLAALGRGATPFDTTIENTPAPCEVTIDGRPVLMCGSNNYFGLSHHPEVVAAAAAALAAYGTSTTGSRAANGSLALHEQLEHEFAACYGKQHALVFTTGYQTNLGLIAGLCGSGDTVLVDLESHASIYDGARLSGAQVFGFRHNSADDLRRKLSRLAEPRRSLVVVEGLYSINGDLAPLGELTAVCRDAGAYLMVDEAHAFGAYGGHGLGAAEAQGVLADVDFIVGTFSKTLAGVGASAFRTISRCGICGSRRDRMYSPRRVGGEHGGGGGGAGDGPARPDTCRASVAQRTAHAQRARASGLSDRRDRVANRADPHRRRGSHDRALAGASRRRSLRQHRPASRVQAGRLPAENELLGRSYAGPAESGARDIRVGRPRAVDHRDRGVKLLLINPRNPVSLYGDYLWQPLALAYIAAATPSSWDVELIDEQCEDDVDYERVEADLVGLTAFTTQAPHAYRIAARLRARGIPVVMGGIHASMLPDEASRYVDSVFVGEAETVWPQVIEDFESRGLQPRYVGPTNAVNMIRPDRSIFAKYPYAYASAQTSRGCPMDCSFCSVTRSTAACSGCAT